MSLLINDGRSDSLALRSDDGGEWRVDVRNRDWGLVRFWARVEGIRSGFDLLDVRHIELIS